ncbi:MAG TPA: dTDP-glucose 4,6-dehydratase [Acidimicrobiia bacterium]|nr:dTDP-glucose 4,6-dehydratase [Acidimicrobiia bacterium]
MRLLVTGAAGFIASNFARYWVHEHPDDRVVGLDLLTYAGNADNLADVADRVPLVVGDIGDRALVEPLLRDESIDVVVNFAAESHNSLAVVDPARFVRTNVLGTQMLLEAARAVGVARFHHVSTCEVYGDLPLDTDDAFTEASPYRPRTPYNASKAAADHLVRAYHETFGVPITISNCANNYGPYQFPEKVIPLFTTLALDDRPLPMYASTHHRREWLHVVDHCRAIDDVLQRGRVGETYNVGSRVEASIEQIADLVLDALGKPASLKTIVPDRPGHDRRYLLDATKLRAELGWLPRVEFDDGVRETVAWYAANRAWWEPLRERAPVVESDWATTGGPTR